MANYERQGSTVTGTRAIVGTILDGFKELGEAQAMYDAQNVETPNYTDGYYSQPNLPVSANQHLGVLNSYNALKARPEFSAFMAAARQFRG